LPPIGLDPTGILLLLVLPLVLAFVLVAFFSIVAVVVESVIVLAAAYLWRGRWLIEATTEDQPQERKTWEARGWRASRRTLDEVARELRSGGPRRPDSTL
jgi:hypothetical protein